AAAHRAFKDALYGQFARIGKALGSPHRLEILELLAQGERTVDSLASEIGLSLANASQHLQALRQAALVESRRQGLLGHYRRADPELCEEDGARRRSSATVPRAPATATRRPPRPAAPGSSSGGRPPRWARSRCPPTRTGSACACSILSHPAPSPRPPPSSRRR